MGPQAGRDADMRQVVDNRGDGTRHLGAHDLADDRL